MPSIDKAKRRVELGDTGHQLRHNIKSLRKRNHLSHTDLAERMSAAGHKVSKTAISEIENGARRVSADDLVALAVALNVPPNVLLLPPHHLSEPSRITGHGGELSIETIWRWALGEYSLIANPDALDALLFIHNSQPGWMRGESSKYDTASKNWGGHGDD